RAVGGFFGPEPGDLKRIRQDIDANYPDWRELLAEPEFVKTFGKLLGNRLLSMPRGYPKDHPAIDLLCHKQFLLRHTFTDEEVCRPDFLFTVNETFRKMRPFLNYMSEVLTTDANGVLVI
ncbi:MAG: DUF2461 family protein, partial [Mucilaginibacter sp.]